VLPAQLRAEFKDIYHACSYFCLESLAKWDQTWENAPALPKPLEFFFDKKPKYEGHAASIYYEVVQKIPGAQGILADMGFGSKEKDRPLQIADLLVGASGSTIQTSKTRRPYR